MISLGITDATPRDVNRTRRGRAVAAASRRRPQRSMLANALLSLARTMIVARSGRRSCYVLMLRYCAFFNPKVCNNAFIWNPGLHLPGLLIAPAGRQGNHRTPRRGCPRHESRSLGAGNPVASGVRAITVRKKCGIESDSLIVEVLRSVKLSLRGWLSARPVHLSLMEH